MKKMSEKPGHVRPANGFYEKLNALMFVPQQELSREQAYWLPANERASQTSNPNSPVTPFVHKSRPPSQVLSSLRQFVEQQLVPFYDHFKKHIQAANDTFFKEIREFEQIFDELEAEYEQCVLDNKNLTIEKKNLLIKNDCLIAECLEKDICSIVLTSDIVVHHSRIAFAMIYRYGIEIGNTTKIMLRQQLQGKDDTIRNLDAQINIMKVLNVGSTEGMEQLSEPPRPSLKPTQKPVVHPKKQTNACVPMSTGVKPTSGASKTVVQIVLWYLDSGCSRHMTGDRARLINFVDKFIGTVRFGNDEYAAIIGYGDYKLGLEVAFRQHSCTSANYDMVDHTSKFTDQSSCTPFSMYDMLSASPVCLRHKDYSTTNTERTSYPQQKGLSKSGPEILWEAARTMLHLCESSNVPWAGSCSQCVFLILIDLLYSLHGKTYYRYAEGQQPNLQYFRVIDVLFKPVQGPRTSTNDFCGQTEAGIDFEEYLLRLLDLKQSETILCSRGKLNMVFIPDGRETDFINGELNEVVYVSQHQKGFVVSEHHSYVYRLQESLIWTQTAPRAWYDKISAFSS
ncbi:hypothetical protein Tco_1055229 [Tanacetum coccineum]|uniref:Retrovirus-related Pol polyprotein from transposon TNT 1-94-like beta-barrel domain-containing protein n=1 Tax=Tanacetum coccineum TaxID=301880 RepID=A0ABQ5H142_9ASTR